VCFSYGTVSTASASLTQGLLPSVSVVVPGCGFALPVYGFVRTLDSLIEIASRATHAALATDVPLA